MNQPQKHIIHKTIQYKMILDDGVAESLNQIGKTGRLTRARVTDILNLVKLPAEMQKFVTELEDTEEIRKYSESKFCQEALAVN